MNVSLASKAQLLRSLADKGSQGAHATISFGEVVKQLGLLGDDLGNASDVAISDISGGNDHLIQLANNLTSNNEVC